MFHSENEIQLYYLFVQNDEYDDALMQFISLTRRERIQKLHSSINKKISLYAELLVRIIACQSLQIKNSNIEFFFNQFGKPYLKDNFSIYFITAVYF